MIKALHSVFYEISLSVFFVGLVGASFNDFSYLEGKSYHVIINMSVGVILTHPADMFICTVR